ncbi:hypothetical protein [Streptomyces rugosispiralis]|uniref:Uncharacterized protein n=1 Tax=Streptomyces rugosispiralis TaxID=2967341 RepID=A0ABT1V682_9ACTN|nr:hypothetical protein [Streptomyces rugosispiralis]MCQ8192896.1 hypothetical protein [Streptomyces rugosispiralis]
MSSTFLGSGPGRRRKPRRDILTIRPSAAGLLLAATATVLCSGPAAPATAAPPPAGAPHDEDREPEEAAPASDQHNGLVVIDNSAADSWLEVDRTLNTLLLSRGTAGSDHDGGGGAIDVVAGDIPGADRMLPQIGHPPWQTGGGD